MRLGSISLRSGRTWWVLFAVLIALPALVLALLGLRVVQLERIERAQQLRDQQSQLTRLADTAIANVFGSLQSDLARAETSPEALRDSPVFMLEPNGRLVFTRERTYFPGTTEFERAPEWPPEIEEMIERAQAAEAQQQISDAVSLYTEVRKSEPRLRAWAELALARIRFEQGDATALTALADPAWSRSDGLTPRGVPVGLAASEGVESASASLRPRYVTLIGATLEGLRAGRWSLQFEERRFYDDELRRLLEIGGSKPPGQDSRLADWAAIETAVRRARPSPGAEHPSDPGGAEKFLILWSPARQQPGAWIGTAIPRRRVAASVSAALQMVFTGQPFHVAIQHADGSVIWTESTAHSSATSGIPLRAIAGWELILSPLDDPHGFDPRRLLWYGLTLMVVLMLGIGVAMTTHVVRREVELARLQSEFLAAVTHEFKSPITSIRLLMERLTNGRYRTPAAADEYHDAINRETDRLERLVNSVLESQKIQSGEKRYNFVSASVVEIAESAIWRLRPQAESKNIGVDLELGREIPTLAIDKASIANALDNLVDNAIKYSPAGSRIRIRIDCREGYVCVEVCDAGIGIDPDDLPRIFDKFYRGRRGDLHNVQGTGLGLALVKAAAEGHGGTVEASSLPGNGSRFCLRLPVEK